MGQGIAAMGEGAEDDDMEKAVETDNSSASAEASEAPSGIPPLEIPSSVNPDDPAVKANLARLPRLSLGALLAPVIWGPAHGYVLVSLLFYPLWVWVDDLIMGAVRHGGLAIPLAVIVTAGTVAFTVFFALTSGPKGYLRVADRVPIETYLRRERIWAVVGVLFAIAVVALATWFNLFLYDTIHPQ